MPQIPPECSALASEVNGLTSEKQALQQDLQEAGPSQKSAIVQQINALNQKIAAAKAKLAKCIEAHPEKPKPPPEAPCREIAEEIALLVSDKSDYQEDLKEAAPGMKSWLVRQIKKINTEIAKKQKEFDRCMIAHGGLPDLAATFTGRATLTTTNSNAPGPFQQSVVIGLLFQKWDHTKFLITNFPPITVGPFDTPAGDNTTTVSLVGAAGGTYDPVSDNMAATVNLHFHHSLALAGDSDITINLATWGGAGTSPLDAGGNVALSGFGTFVDGFLGSDQATLTLTGLISPHP
jgi:hypothetical protein